MHPKQKEREMTVQKVMKALLAASVSLEDVLKPKQGNGTTSKDESFSIALQRLSKQCKRVGNINGQYYVDKDKGTVFFKVGEDLLSENTLMVACREMDKPPKQRLIPLPLRYSLFEIEECLSKLGKPAFGKMSYAEKIEVLWGLGMAVYPEHPEYPNGSMSCKYFVNRETYRGVDNKVEHGLVIVGSERIDSEWLNSGFASDAAILYTDDTELAKDLAEMARY